MDVRDLFFHLPFCGFRDVVIAHEGATAHFLAMASSASPTDQDQ